jgi:protein-S-isoprenylcysteine O-methyltransferase Ste14
MSQQANIFSPRVILQMLIMVVLAPFLPLLISRHWDWWEAWAYGLICVIGFAISRLLVARRHPDLIAERARMLQHEDAASWDKTLAPLLGIASLLILVIAGLDALYGWSPAFSLPINILALIFILASFVLSSYALIENRFFSGMVRIQTDRDHQVVSSGPYRWMRHPGYAGGLLTYLATPFFLDSRWAILAASFTLIVLVIRTRLEDKTLQEQLPGYREYAQRVRYRLLPGVW